ncbi:MAG: flagellar basal body rod protein FlgB [Oscillospiraceae bacterium]|nr:flagellar basal body rod protein FlgB [Oscillospiraceae bacterium]
MDWITNNSMLLAQKSLDYTWQKQRVISENIANAETPGYKGKYVTFEEELRKSLSSIKPGHDYSARYRRAIEESKYTVHTATNESMRLDGNNVVVDVENVELARTQLQYDALINRINGQFSKLRTVITAR